MDSTLTRTEDVRNLLETLRSFRRELEGSGGVENIAGFSGFLGELEEHLTQLHQGFIGAIGFELLRKTALLLARAVDEDEVLAAMLDGLREVLPYDAAGIYLVNRENPLREEWEDNGDGPGTEDVDLSAVVARGYDLEEHRKFRQKFNEGIVGWVIANGKSLVVDDTTQDERYIKLRPETRSEISVPIISRDVVIGAINLEADRVAAFPDESVNLLENLASYAAVALQRARTQRELMTARTVERELEIAREIQERLLPVELPELTGYDFAGFNVPSDQVGGDYYDFIPITAKDIGIVIADVAGKGFAAGLVMASLRSALRMRVETTYSIRHVMGNVNRFLYDSTGPERYVTAFYGVFDSATGRLTYVNAGHNPPLLIHRDGRIAHLGIGGPLLGVIRDAQYDEAIAEIEPGAMMVLFTDGIIEAGGDHGEEFGERRILEIVKRIKQRPAAEIAREIDNEAVRFHGMSSSIDDRTVLVVKRL